MYLLNAIEKLAYRMDAMEKRLRRTEELIYHVMEGSAIKRQGICLFLILIFFKTSYAAYLQKQRTQICMESTKVDMFNYVHFYQDYFNLFFPEAISKKNKVFFRYY